MEIIYTEPFQRDYNDFPELVQKALEKALRFLMQNMRHPSLRVKKLPGTSIWYGRITKSHRFTFQPNENTIILRRVGTHAILTKERENL